MIEFNPKELMSKKELLKGVETMNSFGARYTGCKAHKEFIEYLKNEIKAMDIEVNSDLKTFMRWEKKSASLTLHTENGDEDIPVSSAYPYSGTTGPDGVRGQLVEVYEKHIGFIPKARDKICVVKVSNLSVPTVLVEDRRNSKPEGLDLPRRYGGPVLTTFANFPLLKVAQFSGAKAVICIWEGISDDCVEGQYLPFILDYQGMPAIWVNPTQGKRVLEAIRKGEEATVVLDADIEEYCQTETFYSIIEGENNKEAIIVNTHTDGVNCVEENGPIALLSMMRYFKKHKPKRSIIFVFMTGHFRLPALKAPGAIQVTSRWLKDHPELWDGELDHIKAVAGLTVEHLGCEEFTDNEGHNAYLKTNPIDIEMCYTGNEKLDEIYYEALEGRDNVRTVSYRGCNVLHFGEGQPLFNVGIPTISLVPGPSYLCVVDEKNHCMDKFDIDLMAAQVETFTKAALIIDGTPTNELGVSDGYTFGVVTKFEAPHINKIKAKIESLL